MADPAAANRATVRFPRLLAIAALLATHLRASVAAADDRYDGVEWWGSLQSQNIVRHPDLGHFHFIQQRNTLRLGLRWSVVDGGRAPDPVFDLIDDAQLLLLYRAVYDSVYDYAPVWRERDLRGRKPSRRVARDLRDLSSRARDAIKFENDLREAYLDLRSRRAGLWLRIGRQQIVWGEADLFRMLDRANPLDTSWHFVEEIPPPSFGWDDLRIPLWMVRARYDAGRLGPFARSEVELYWNPGDWRPVKVAFLPRPWGVRLLHPLTNREDGAFVAPFSGIRRLAYSSLFRQGNYRRTPAENSQVGLQLSWTSANGVRSSLYYFHQRWAGDDGTPTAVVRGFADTPSGRVETQNLIAGGSLPVEYIAPYIHTVGASASGYLEAFHSNVRVESVYDFGLPMFNRNKATTLAPLLPGISKRDFWKAMVAFDRPLTVPTVNDEGAVFVTAQWFVHHLVHNKDALTGPLDLPTAGARARPYCGAGPTKPCPDPRGNGSFRDDVRSWEVLLTIAAFTAYAGGSLVPVAGVVVDPVNSYGINAFWNLAYTLRPGLTVDLTQRYFATAQGDVQKGPFTPWLFGTMRGRSETAIRVTCTF